ncbi:glycosyltransferase family 4 protein [Clostridium perfringens]|uniref:glycosyltransferase family 4 protein n=1 Tax=Clostridium perfringens TaxID=1502 RepID=UPI001A259BD3|nr:glycosyltransferase family 4 protein [Clostridium perfringens]MDZ4906155.1 glycosyltransferase [Clostridium perfringens]HAT4224175.1 glycosyltransferase family 4 protein [Clostridium perfringens]
MSYKILDYKLKNISELGYDVSIISSNDCEVDDSIFRNNNIKTFFINMNRKINIKDDLISIIKLKNLLKEEDFDLVHTHTAKAGIIGRVAAKLAGVPVIIHTSHGLPYFDGMSKSKYLIYKNIERIGAIFSNRLGSQNKEDLKKLQELTKNKKKVFYEGNGVDLDYLDYESSNISEESICNLKRELNIDKDKIIILMAARFESVKNHKLFIDAINEVVKVNKNIICILAGDGPLENEIKGYIREYNLDNIFRLVGKRNDIYKFIKFSDIVALTSIKEGIPRIIMESMAFEKPVVATNVLGTRELVINKETGLLSELNDVNDLVNNMKVLINDKSLRNIYGKNARIRIESDFTEKMVAKRLDVIYSECLKI